ncbi:septum formation initiator family protein [Herbiconiux sp. KACC 21604]|uniref:FtsB family cell division protein n=1 Tax=unclassified Herbiconiux TaxID=2618217 RepID=UPI001492B7C6|nr:septum formation initiator family protein [Herbiconiux sp. SALV-R1]QJU54003.1 septum formation initiator family protein [Herbiconiux sp. SALV-R1]WPO85032.1 septum formation initiator family protein [Herbiconiux sp. KACC 21604]
MRQRAPESRSKRIPVALPQATAAGPGSWLRSIRFSGFTVLMFVVIVMFVIIIAPGLRVYIEQRQQLAALHAAVDDRSAENDSLTEQVARWSDPAYIKAEARDRLYYVMPGETSFLVVDDVPAVAGGGDSAPSDTISTTQVDWLSSLFVSGMTAGLSTATPNQLQNDGVVQ